MYQEWSHPDRRWIFSDEFHERYLDAFIASFIHDCRDFGAVNGMPQKTAIAKHDPFTGVLVTVLHYPIPLSREVHFPE